MLSQIETIGVIGGTGAQGKGLALRLANAGYPVVVGSRDSERARITAKELLAELPRDAEARVAGASNHEAAGQASVVLIATPWDASPTSHAWLAPHALDKVVISCVNPLGFDAHGPYGLDVSAGSAAEHIAMQLPDARVAGAFHHVAADRLVNLNLPLDEEDVLVASDDLTALMKACELADAVTGNRGVDAGPLRSCRILEPLTAVLISINVGYRSHSGVAICNLVRSVSGRMHSAT